MINRLGTLVIMLDFGEEFINKQRGEKKMSKSDQLMSDWGVNTNDPAAVDTFLMDCVFDSLNPGICQNDGCDYSTDVEPDQGSGYCEICGTKTVTSISLLMGII